jgi:hypothetical protein
MMESRLFILLQNDYFDPEHDGELVTDFRLLPARNRSPFKYHCDHLDASLSVKNRVKISV